MKIIFRGTSDAHRVPRLYCECEICQEARTTGINRRYRSSVQLAVNEDSPPLWIDCGPDWYEQMMDGNERVIEHMLITHAHYDHIGGLPQWYDQFRYIEIKPKLYAAEEVIGEINTRFPWLASGIEFIALDSGYEFGDWLLRTWRVNHGRNGYSYAFRFDHRLKPLSFVYCPDSIALSTQQQKPFYDVDVLIIGASYYKEPFPFETRSLYDVTELIELNKQWKPKQLWITHMSHDIDIRKSLPEHMNYAQTGTVIEL